MFISPTEPQPLRDIGITSSIPETYGVDIMWESRIGTIGIQRKAFPADFLASVQDGRLALEFQQMKQLAIPILLLEGRQQWTAEGELYGSFGNPKRSYTWTRVQHRNFLTTVQLRGVQVQTSDSIPDTIDYLHGLRLWAEKGDHNSLDRRANPQADAPWGSVSNADWINWLYQSWPGIGPKQAGLIQKHLGVILRLTVGAEDLATVPGIGKGISKRIVEMMNGHG